jgi:hypothetical protein
MAKADEKVRKACVELRASANQLIETALKLEKGLEPNGYPKHGSRPVHRVSNDMRAHQGPPPR